ncbi:MAG: hypothetical protein AB7L41_09025 [Flavobacteriaceae bacterium]
MPFVAATLAAIAGFAGGWAAAFFGLYPLFQKDDRDGGIAMGFAFTIAPAVGIVCAIALAVWAFRKVKAQHGAGPEPKA